MYFKLLNYMSILTVIFYCGVVVRNLTWERLRNNQFFVVLKLYYINIYAKFTYICNKNCYRYNLEQMTNLKIFWERPASMNFSHNFTLNQRFLNVCMLLYGKLNITTTTLCLYLRFREEITWRIKWYASLVRNSCWR